MVMYYRAMEEVCVGHIAVFNSAGNVWPLESDAGVELMKADLAAGHGVAVRHSQAGRPVIFGAVADAVNE